MSGEEAGLRRDGGAEMFLRRLRVALLEQERAEVDMSFGVFRIDIERAAVPRDRLIRPAELFEVDADVVVRLGLVGLDRDGAFVLFDRAGVITTGHQGQGKA